MIPFADLHAQYLTIKSDIDAAIADVIQRAAFIGGRDVSEFEREFAAYQEVDSCVGVGNGTDAIEIALEALDLPKCSEVIVPANSFISTSEAVTRSGHRVVFADVDPKSYTLDVEDVKRRITPRTAAIIVVHLYGHPANMTELLRIAGDFRLKVIEDCAQAHGARYGGRRLGGIGDVGTFSFYPGKNLGAYGDAGAIVTSSESLAQSCRMIANHGRIDKYNHQVEGRNSRLDGIQAAILRVKLRHLDSWIERRNQIAAIYCGGLEGLGDIALPSVAPGDTHAFHLFVIRTVYRDELASFLRARNTYTGIHYPIALPKLKAYEHLHCAEEPMFANGADALLLSLPIGEHLSDGDATEVIKQIREFFGTV